jgi:hypothetical protein
MPMSPNSRLLDRASYSASAGVRCHVTARDQTPTGPRGRSYALSEDVADDTPLFSARTGAICNGSPQLMCRQAHALRRRNLGATTDERNEMRTGAVSVNQAVSAQSRGLSTMLVSTIPRDVSANAPRSWLHMLARRVSVLAVIVAALPMLLGPTTGVVLMLVGAGTVHHCACGMKPGHCGCPDCARIQRGLDASRSQLRCVVRTACNDDAAAPVDGVVPPAISPSHVIVPRPPDASRLIRSSPGFPKSQNAPEPPTPPPKIRIA